MNAYEAARLIDISAVRTHHGLKDIQEVVDIAKKYKFINVHALPWLSWTARYSKATPTPSSKPWPSTATAREPRKA